MLLTDSQVTRCNSIGNVQEEQDRYSIYAPKKKVNKLKYTNHILCFS